MPSEAAKSFRRKGSPWGGSGRDRLVEQHSSKAQPPAGSPEGTELASYGKGSQGTREGPRHFNADLAASAAPDLILTLFFWNPRRERSYV